MNYIRTTDFKYPLSEHEIKNLFSNVSFSTPFVPPVEFSYVFSTPKPEYDPVLNVVVEDVPQLTTKGHWEQSWKIVPLFTKTVDKTAAKASHLAAQKILKKELVNTTRKVKESAGLSYTFTDSVGTIQTSDEDIRNILAVTTTALVLKSQSITTPVIQFRDQENVIHALTADDAIALGLAVQQFISSTYSDSWDKKVEIDSALTLIELNEVVV